MKTISSLITVLLLEDSRNENESLASFLPENTESNLAVKKVSQIDEGLNYLRDNLVRAVLLNLKSADIRKFKVCQEIYKITPQIPIIFIVGSQKERLKIANYNLKFFAKQALTQDYLLFERVSLITLKKLIAAALSKAKVVQQLQDIQQTNQKLRSELKDTQELFRTVVDTTSALIWMIDANGKYTFLNQSWLSFTGQSIESGLKESWRDRIHTEDLDKCNRVYQAALKKCQGFQIEYRLKRFDGTYKTILNTAVRRHNSNGEFAGLLCSCLDITQRKEIEQQVVKQAEIDRILADITQSIHSSLDLTVILQTAAEQVNQYLQPNKIFISKIVERSKLILLFESGLNSSTPSCNISLNNKLPVQVVLDNFKRLTKGEIIAQDNTYFSEIIKSDRVNLSCVIGSLLLVPIISHHQLWGLICIEQNAACKCWQVDEIKLLERVAIQLGIAIKQSELYRELEELSVIDGLTKIANRRKFDSYLATEWKRLTREQNPLSLILCDVDHFKLYNDTYGHQAGDRCLQDVAQTISQTIKRPADLVARYGGEEIAVILPNTDIDGAKYLAQQIRLKIESLKIPHINSPVDLYITLSFGVSSCIPNGDLGFYALVSAADQGLYKAKKLGRNRVEEFSIDDI